MNKYQCDGCDTEITGRKAYDIIQKAKYGKGLRGFCSMSCYHSFVKIKPKECEFCGLSFLPEDKSYKFCSHSCSAKSSNKNRSYDFLNGYKESKCIECGVDLGVRKTASVSKSRCNPCRIIYGKKYCDDRKVITISECFVCSNRYEYRLVKSKFCSDVCRQVFIKDKASLAEYRRMCQFKFSMKKFPTEFEFDLIKKYGMYSPANKGNNLGGVSRDHMVSVRYGFEHKIDPSIIGHPANCKLMIHTENISKMEDCSISLEELNKKIKTWNKKYGQFGAAATSDDCRSSTHVVNTPGSSPGLSTKIKPF